MRKALALGTVAASFLGLAVAAVPANAADTPVTFTLAAGSLTITAPTSAVTLAPAGGLSVTGTSVGGSLGSTTVNDARGTLAHSVTVTMAASDFTTTGHTITKSNATGYSGLATASGTAVAVPTATGVNIGGGSGATILTLNSVLGSGGATYNPTVAVTVPNDAIAGTYTGTITQTVA